MKDRELEGSEEEGMKEGGEVLENWSKKMVTKRREG